MITISEAERSATLSRRDRDTGLCRQKGGIPGDGGESERPAENAGGTSHLISEGLRSETDPAGFEKEEFPAGVFEIPAGVWEWTDQR